MYLKQQGWYQRVIAEALDTSEETISRWLARARQSGREALLAHPAPGHPPKLSDAQKHRIPEFLWHGPEAYGFRGQVWTRARIILGLARCERVRGIAARLEVDPATIWRAARRFDRGGLDALFGARRSASRGRRAWTCA